MIAVSSACVACCCLTTMAHAKTPTHHLDVAGGGAAWVSPYIGGNGYLLASYQRLDGWRGMRSELLYNTDTLQLSASNIVVSDALHVGGYVKGQAGAAGVLINYFERGQSVPERTFGASYVQGAATVGVYTAPLFLDLELGVRRWAFTRLPDRTAQEFVLPPNMWTFEPRVRVTWWRFEHDDAFSSQHRQTWRLRGIGAGLELAQDIRRRWQPWGDLEPEGGARRADERNIEGRHPVMARAWLKAGHQLHDRLRVQSALFAAVGLDEDDLTRVRVGGMNPYVISLAGMPWPAYLPDNFGAVQLSAHTALGGQHELGVFFDGVTMHRADALRAAHSGETDGQVEYLSGIGLVGDFRWGEGWQADAKVGWTLPTSSTIAEHPHIALWLSLGKRVF